MKTFSPTLSGARRNRSVGRSQAACGRDFDDDFEPDGEDEEADWHNLEPDPDELVEPDECDDLEPDDEDEFPDEDFPDDESWDDDFDAHTD